MIYQITQFIAVRKFIRQFNLKKQTLILSFQLQIIIYKRTRTILSTKHAFNKRIRIEPANSDTLKSTIAPIQVPNEYKSSLDLSKQ